MFQSGTLFEVIDNSGAKTARCITVLEGFRHKIGTIGNKLVVSIQDLRLIRKVKPGQVCLALFVRSRQLQTFKDGSQSSMFKNAIVLLNKKNQLLGTRINGPVSRKLRKKKFLRVLLLSNMLYL
jgi:large subunit ribosomal protein L14